MSLHEEHLSPPADVIEHRNSKRSISSSHPLSLRSRWFGVSHALNETLDVKLSLNSPVKTPSLIQTLLCTTVLHSAGIDLGSLNKGPRVG